MVGLVRGSFEVMAVMAGVVGMLGCWRFVGWWCVMEVCWRNGGYETGEVTLRKRARWDVMGGASHGIGLAEDIICRPRRIIDTVRPKSLAL